MKKIKIGLLLGVIIFCLAAVQFKKMTTEPGPLQEIVYAVIPKGASLRQAAYNLEAAGVISHPRIFMIFGRIKGIDKRLRAGEYQFNPKISMLGALEKMARGEVYYHKLTLPEGKTTKQMLEMIKANPDLSGEVTLTVGEGEMLPETYSFELNTERNEIVRQAVDAMSKAVDEVWEKREENLPISSKREMVILASIIEKETAIASERRTVASVFVNRLEKGMRLQTDPTVIYALTQGEGDLGRSLKKADLAIDSPYNTYKYAGLPPAPICNPSKESLMAAIYPEFSDYLYFVADGKGGHNFSRTYKEHSGHVNNWVKTIRQGDK